LAKRLLDQTSVNDDFEDMMISKLKIHCGPSALIKTLQMKKDIKISKDLFSEYTTI